MKDELVVIILFACRHSGGPTVSDKELFQLSYLSVRLEQHRHYRRLRERQDIPGGSQELGVHERLQQLCPSGRLRSAQVNRDIWPCGTVWWW